MSLLDNFLGSLQQHKSVILHFYKLKVQHKVLEFPEAPGKNPVPCGSSVWQLPTSWARSLLTPSSKRLEVGRVSSHRLTLISSGSSHHENPCDYTGPWG